MVISRDWQEHSVSLSSIKRQARELEPWEWGVFGFLQNIGVVPWSVKSVAASKVRLNIDPENVPAGYLASVAYEWDSWGKSQPSEFISMLEAELDPNKRDFVSAILTGLGRS